MCLELKIQWKNAKHEQSKHGPMQKLKTGAVAMEK